MTENDNEKPRNSIHLGNLRTATKASEINPVVVPHPKWLTVARKNPNLHGSAPDKCAMALLLIDVINDLEFPEADQMVDEAVKMARNLAQLKKRAKKAGVPAIYVNDNFGRWKSDFRATVEHCLRKNVRGREVVKILAPEKDDYFVLKPKHSGFFSTTLETLLRYLEPRTLILTGIAGNFCGPLYRKRCLHA
ncbi:MAG TPA: isochorismatase family cysteine hydrolase [Chthoniobacterales bacterium]